MSLHIVKRSIVVLIAISVLLSSLVLAVEEHGGCKDHDDYQEKFRELDSRLAGTGLQFWEYMHEFYLDLVKKFPHCDYGAGAQRLSDEVGYLLGVRWDQFSRLENIAKKDKAFVQFVIGHLDSSAAPKTLEAIIQNTRQKCSDTAKALCLEIEKRAETLMSSSRTRATQ